MSALSLGPWIFPVAVLGLVLGIIAAEAAAAFMSRRGHADAGRGVWIVLVVALLGARAAYVIQFWSSYRLHLLDIIDLRDLGLNWIGGVLGMLLALVVLARRKPAWWPALPASLVAGLAVWMLVDVAAVQLRAGSHPSLPTLTLHDLEGREVQLTSLKGKPMVVNLWATWCPPCRREMPVLVEAQKTHTQVRFVFADQDESSTQVKRFLADQGLAPRNLLIDGTSQLARYYRAPGYPTTVFLSADGRLREIQVGPLSHATLREHLQRLAPAPASSHGEVR